ncbi:MAG TPA: hypothetical protein VG204_06835 [Terriglobia bacterium]|nr:hypothetical protein [Terriglobia bacterium]
MTRECGPSFDAYDLLFLVCLFALVLGFAAHTFGDPPAEDAAILMRYSQHLAQGHGIVWNVGEGPVEGATDFLFMVILGGLAKLGMSLVAAARLVDLVAHALTVCLIYAAIRPASRAAAAFSASYLAFGPAFAYVSTCFGTPLFALFAATTWWLALRLRSAKGWAAPFGFALSGLVLGLVRPEGVILAGLMLVAIVYRDGWRQSRPVIVAFIGVFAVLGGAYFVWRWHYFGYLLPNPFYVKGGFALHWSGFWMSLMNSSTLLGPLLFVYAAGLSMRRSARETITHLIPIAGFTLAWMLLTNEQNLFMRFQYAVLPIALISWYPLWQLVCARLDLRVSELGGPGLFLVASIVVAWLLLYRGGHWAYVEKEWDPDYDVGHILAAYQGKGYSLATNQSGLLPLYSGWRALDTWGLNSPTIAHRGRVIDADLQAAHAEVIVFYTFRPRGPLDPEWTRWLETARTIRDYLRHNDYVLAAVVVPDEYEMFCYYVRRDCVDGPEIIRRIRSQESAWAAEGRVLSARPDQLKELGESGAPLVSLPTATDAN